MRVSYCGVNDFRPGASRLGRSPTGGAHTERLSDLSLYTMGKKSCFISREHEVRVGKECVENEEERERERERERVCGERARERESERE